MPSDNEDLDRCRTASHIDRRRLLWSGAAVLAASPVASCGQSTVKAWDKEYDVIVVGCGVSGACAAYEAAAAGASVLILDKGSAAIFESHGSYIYMGGGTKLQKLYNVEDTPDDMMKYLLASNGPSPDKPRIEKYVERSIPDFDWLVSIGTPFSQEPLPGSPINPSAGSLDYTGDERSALYRNIAKPARRGHSPHTLVNGAAGGGSWLQRRLLELTRTAGATQLLAAEGKHLHRDGKGVVEGVTAEVDGKLASFRAKRGVIIATGGFAFNQEMLALHAPSYLSCQPVDVSSNDGWGIRAGQSIGAAVKGMSAVSATWVLYPPLSRKQGILVNGQGNRFIAEDAYFGRVGNAIVNEQHGVAYLLLDEVARGTTPTLLPLKVAAQGDDIVEIGRRLNIAAPSLQQTLDTYNSYAAKGSDPFFHKEREYLRPLKPPYTVIHASVADTMLTFFTLGGLWTNPKSEALDVDGAVIPRLYAIGKASAGITCSNYYSSGLSLGEAVTFGRIAGAEAARNV